MMVDILVHYDSLNHEYTKMAEDTGLLLWARHTANRARLKLNKYYSISDISHIYRLALCKSIYSCLYLSANYHVVLHPSNHKAYLVRLEWTSEWISEACDIAIDYWVQFYKPDDYGTGDDTSSQSQFGYSVSLS
jgi:hypothetical protein